HITVGEIAPVEPARSVADCKQFGVSGGVAVQDDVVPTFTDDRSVTHNDGAIRLIAFLQRLLPQRAGACNETGLCLLLGLDDRGKTGRVWGIDGSDRHAAGKGATSSAVRRERRSAQDVAIEASRI